MPTYNYLCQACEHEFEEFQAMSDAVLVKCPACGKKKLRRLIGTGAAIVFKGSGFYQTDYRSDADSKSKKAETASPTGTTETPLKGDKAEAKKASKPEK